MTYHEAIDFLLHKTVSFEMTGSDGYKPGLERVRDILSRFGNPHYTLRTIHIAGTNGKGSTASLLASILQASGYRVGLFTSPHLIDFRERIRINGEMISEDAVTAFVDKVAPAVKKKEIEPSFFELTTAMAFEYFRDEKVDYAVIEAGMGGRLDSTNVLKPLVSVITNVSMDHTQYLGDTLSKIAAEKAGIIKPGVPVVLGNSRDGDVKNVITNTAFRQGAELIMADRTQEIMMHFFQDSIYRISTVHFGNLTLPLMGAYQIENAATVLQVVLLLMREGLQITPESVREGFLNVSSQGLRARLEVIRDKNPRVIADAGHNPGAWLYLSNYLRDLQNDRQVACILGFSGDKDIDSVLSLLPRDLPIIFTTAATPRAEKSRQLLKLARKLGFENVSEQPDIRSAYMYALNLNADKGDFTIFIGGSFYLLGEFLQMIKTF